VYFFLSSDEKGEEEPGMMGGLERLRSRIDRIDRRIVRLLKKRFSAVGMVGSIKRREGLAVVQPEREAEVLNRITDRLESEGLKGYVTAVYRALFEASYRVEEDR
jgi:chorismate mutase